jgi:aminoglycoside 3-N-acetyltransferase
MSITRSEIAATISAAGLGGRSVCVHSSLRSFGHVDGGAGAVVGAFLDAGCTMLVPAFTCGFGVPPPVGACPPRNGMGGEDEPTREEIPGRAFSPADNDLDRPDMGAIPAAVLATPGRSRGDNPLNSFAAVGPLARQLVAGQTPADVYAPFRALADAGGAVVMIGVHLTTMTLIHEAERRAGRTLLRRWARGRDGRIVTVHVGSCSDGFNQFETVLAPLSREVTVGESRWRAFPAADTLAAAAAAIRANPAITHCGRTTCARCRDMVAGGPQV